MRVVAVQSLGAERRWNWRAGAAEGCVWGCSVFMGQGFAVPSRIHAALRRAVEQGSVE